MSTELSDADIAALESIEESKPEEKAAPAHEAAPTVRAIAVVKEFVDIAKFRGDVAINPLTIDDSFVTQASMFAHYGILAAAAAKQVDKLKLKVKTVEAELNNRYRKQFLADGVKSTEGMIANAVATDARYIKAQRDYIDAEEQLEIAKIATEGFRQRRDMLIQLGADAREERKGELFTRSRPEAVSNRAAEIAQRRGEREAA